MNNDNRLSLSESKNLFSQALQRQNDRAAGMKMPDDMEQRVMGSLTPNPSPRRGEPSPLPLRRSPLLWRGIGGGCIAVAASVLLLIMLNIEKPQPEQQTPVIAEKVMSPVPAISDEPIEHAKPTRPIKPVKVAKAATPKKRPIEAELPDTLGQSIFESEENVRIAMQILCECEATIRQEKQQTRNYIIEATFNALPHAEDAQLVRGENGDLEVMQVSQQTAIEI